MNKKNLKCVFGTWVNLENIDDKLTINHDDFNITIEVVGEEVVSGLDRVFSLDAMRDRNDQQSFNFPLFASSNNILQYHDDDENFLGKSLHYNISVNSLNASTSINYPFYAYNSISRDLSGLIKKRPENLRGKRISNPVQSHIITNWYQKNLCSSWAKIITPHLVKMIDNFNFITKAFYRRIKSNMGEGHLMRLYSSMNLLRFHCDGFREDKYFINDFFGYNAPSYMISNSCLSDEYRVAWYRDRDLGDDNDMISYDWRDAFVTKRNHFCPNKRYVIENLPRQMPVHVFQGPNSVFDETTFDQKTKDKSYILFKCFSINNELQRKLDLIIDTNIFEMEDFKKSLQLYCITKNSISKIYGTRHTKDRKYSTRQTSAVSSFVQDLDSCYWLRHYQNSAPHVDGFCFSSLYHLTVCFCLSMIKNCIPPSGSTDEDKIKKVNKKVLKMEKDFIKSHPEAINMEEEFDFSSSSSPF
jgi:hypothetical protein